MELTDTAAQVPAVAYMYLIAVKYCGIYNLLTGDELRVVYGRRAGDLWFNGLYNTCVAASDRGSSGRL